LSRTHRFLGGLSFGYLQQILVIVAGLWLTPFFLQRLGQHDYGLWLILTQITAYLGLLDLGVVGLLPRETAYVMGREGVESAELTRLVGHTVRVVFLQLPVVSVCAGVVWLLGRRMWASAQFPLSVILLVFIAMFPFRIFPAVLQGLQDLAFLARAQIASWSAGTVAAVALVFQGHGLLALAMSWAVTQIASTIICFYRVKRKFPSVLPTRYLGHFDQTAAFNRLKKGAWISASQIAQILTMGSDMLLIGKLLGAGATVPYSCTGKLAGVLANKPQMMMQTAFPALSELRTSGTKASIRRATMALGQAMLAVSGAVGCLVLSVNRQFVGWWIGPNQYGGTLLTLLIVAAMLVRHWNLTFTYSLFCFGHERRLAITGLADGCVSIIASTILIPLIGVIGAPIGMLAGTCLVNIPSNLIALSREMDVSPRILVTSSGNWLFRFVMAGAIGMGLARVWNPQNLVSVTTLAVAAGTVYMTLLIPVIFREPLGSYIRPRLSILPPQLQKMFPAVAD